MRERILDVWTPEEFEARLKGVGAITSCSWGIATIRKPNGQCVTVIIFHDQDTDKTLFAFEIGSDGEAHHFIKNIMASRLMIHSAVAESKGANNERQ